MQARYYDPVIGRFYSNDPVSFTNIHNFNRYAYANNNPYKYIDPDGNNSVIKYATPFLKSPSLKTLTRTARAIGEAIGVVSPANVTANSGCGSCDVPDSGEWSDDVDDDPNQYAKRNKKEKNKDNPNKKKTSRGDRNVKSDDPEQAKANEKADGKRRNRAKKDKQLKPKKPKEDKTNQ